MSAELPLDVPHPIPPTSCNTGAGGAETVIVIQLVIEKLNVGAYNHLIVLLKDVPSGVRQ
jgi:hypothetical protein